MRRLTTINCPMTLSYNLYVILYYLQLNSLIKCNFEIIFIPSNVNGTRV